MARNLGLPIESLADAAAAAVSGQDRTIDVGWLVVDPDESQCTGDLDTGADNVHCFTVMAGVGLDAQIMDDAPEGVKDKAGWVAYFASGGNAEVDDALLDVATVSPESLTEWVGLASRVLAKRGDGPSLRRDQGRDLTVRVDPPQLCEVDGDVLTEAGQVRFVVQPACLVVRVGRDGA